MGGSDVVGELTAGRAFADLSAWRKIAVRGGDAVAWLNDLVSADIGGLGPGQALPSLLLSPTGRIRAAFTVAIRDDGPLLLQDAGQRAVDELLAPYVLSSDAILEDRTEALALFAFPGSSTSLAADIAAPSSPSCVGAGADLLAEASKHAAVLAALRERYRQAGPGDVEAWRVAAGIPRFGIDALEDDLPEEGGLAGAVSFDKGCYLGQEAVAKVRNLGHPRRVVVHLSSASTGSTGDVVEAGGERAGEVTSARAAGGRTWLLARIGWRWREGPFSIGGAPLRIEPSPRIPHRASEPPGTLVVRAE